LMKFLQTDISAVARLLFPLKNLPTSAYLL
jgi:hypothetical protein